MDEVDRSWTTEPARKLGFVFEDPVLGESSCFGEVLGLVASWKVLEGPKNRSRRLQ
jgi:hypothetical protein